MILYYRKSEAENVEPVIDSIRTAIYSIKPDCERKYRRMSFEERYEEAYVRSVLTLMPYSELSSYGEYSRIPNSEHTVFYKIAYNSMSLLVNILVINRKLKIGDTPRFGTEKFIVESIRDRLLYFPICESIYITTERPYRFNRRNAAKVELSHPAYL